jgi:hypothetical protein
MNKMIRVLFVLFFLAIFVAIGMNGTAWADKLKGDNASPAENGVGVALPRPHGTVNSSPTCIKTNKPGKFLVGSVANWKIEKIPSGNSYSACVAKERDLPRKTPGHLLSSPIKLAMVSGNTFDIVQQICFPVVPGSDGSALYWDGKTWIKTEDAKDGQACVTAPLVSPNPTYVGFGEDK